MAQSTKQHLPIEQVEALIESIVNTQRISRQNHLRLSLAILANPHLQPKHRYQINQIFDGLRTGKLQIEDL